MAETNPNPPTYIAITNWSVVEVNMGVIIPCLIVLKPLISKIWPAFGSGTRDSKSAGNAAPANVLTIGGSGQPHGDASFQQVSIQSNGAFSVTPSGTEKSLYDIESTAGTSEGGTPMKSKAGEVESVESVNSLHHKFLVDEARESKRHSTIVELA
jgi:hypothetical protein